MSTTQRPRPSFAPSGYVCNGVGVHPVRVVIGKTRGTAIRGVNGYRNKDSGSRHLDEQLGQFRVLVSQFLEQVPVGGSNDKAIKSQISEIKRELRSLVKWDQLFYTYKAMSFPSEVEYIFTLEGHPIAAVWHYNPLDEQGEYRKTYSHQQRDGHVYAVRSNWAIDKGLMRAEPNGYIDAISRPKQEIGCMCWYEWLYAIRDLPDDMVTEKGP